MSAAGRAGSGAVEPRVARELPGLELCWRTLTLHPGTSPPDVRARLRTLSNRYDGARVVAMRTQPLVSAYRAFFRHIGLDPDIVRVPSEAAALRRLLEGGFRSRDLVSDALLIALLETNVPVWGLDAALADPDTLGIRTASAGERLGSGASASVLSAGQLVVADARHVHAALFADPAAGHGPGVATRELVAYAVGVPGVPAIALEEALWTCGEALGLGRVP
jgi:DNA/RNA-binding domain of Phe-tRNA-synthetase-like protein